ncbi:hypothetical protein HDV01_001354 [Terramyces sp. JEL0728]|nr:hypothetical protein HDV01_001354 [Terramyces sp. JEL0728]
MAVTEHLLAFTFREISHFLPTFQLCTVLAKTKNIHTTIMVDQNTCKEIIDRSLISNELLNSIPGVALFQFTTAEDKAPQYLEGLINATPVAVHELSERLPVTGFIFETFGAQAFPATLQFNLPHYVFYSINALATTLRVATDFYPELYKTLPDLPDQVTREVCKQAVSDVELMYWLNKRFRTPSNPTEEPVQAAVPIQYNMHDNTNIVKAMKTARAVWINSFEGFDTESSLQLLLDHPEMKSQFKLIGPVGVYDVAKQRKMDSPVIEWLDTQKEASVLYIAHGSYLQIKDEEVPEMEQALLELDIPFIWSLNEKKQALLKDKSLIVSPDSIPINHRGIITTWAPQVPILQHRSTGAFLSHTGWNSTLEAIGGGVPVISWPISAEQFVNGSMIAAKDMGVLVEGTSKTHDTIVKCSEIKDKIGQVLPKESTSPFKAKMIYLQNAMQQAVRGDGKSITSLC